MSKAELHETDLPSAHCNDDEHVSHHALVCCTKCTRFERQLRVVCADVLRAHDDLPTQRVLCVSPVDVASIGTDKQHVYVGTLGDDDRAVTGERRSHGRQDSRVVVRGGGVQLGRAECCSQSVCQRRDMEDQ